MGKLFDELVNSLRSRVAEIIGVGVLAAMGGWVVAFGQWHPLLRFAVLFVVLLIAVEVARAWQHRKDTKGKLLVQRLIDRGIGNGVGLLDEVRSTKVIWAMWYSGNQARSDRVLDSNKIGGRVLLLLPNDDHEALKRATNEAGSPLDETKVDIVYIARHALLGGFQTGFYTRYYGFSMTLYDPTPTYNRLTELEPDSDNAWVVVKHLNPKIGASGRTIERIYKAQDPIQFQGYLDIYRKEWAGRIEGKLKDGRVTTEKHQWEVRLECKLKAE